LSKPKVQDKTIGMEILQRSTSSVILAISDTLVGKVVFPPKHVWVNASTGKEFKFGEDPTVASERIALEYANRVSSLLPQCHGVSTWQDENGTSYDMLLLERLYPLPLGTFTRPIREEMAATFLKSLRELHDRGFVHGDLMRPTNYYNRNDQEWIFGNIIQTHSGLRLLDAGFSQLRSTTDNYEWYSRALIREEAEGLVFRKYYLSLPVIGEAEPSSTAAEAAEPTKSAETTGSAET
jgi:hypothetical protein